MKNIRSCFRTNIIKKIKDTILSPVRLTVISFAAAIILGSLLLTLPATAKDGKATNFINALFTATSATCVTGLTVFDTFAKWNIFGQLIILTLIQIGGLGLITLVVFFSMYTNRKMGIKNMQIAQEAVGFGDVIEIKSLIKLVVKVSLIIESLGAALLAFRFIPKYNIINGIYISIFLAVSAFCNAGIDIIPHNGSASFSLTNYNSDPVVLPVIALLIIIGGLGFVVWYDIFLNKERSLMLHTKVVLIISGTLLFLGTFVFLFLEWNNPETLGGLSFGAKINAAFFQSATVRTAGFFSVNPSHLNNSTKLFLICLMFIGGAPGSTAGGIKVTTIAVIWKTITCFIRGKNDTVIFNRRVHKQVVYKSISIFGISILATIISSIVVYITTQDILVSGIDAVFESVSAIGTVGISVGISSVASKISKLILILVMFAGRVGPVTLMLAFLRETPENRLMLPEAKIMIG